MFFPHTEAELKDMESDTELPSQRTPLPTC
jgi:hypothetical protein